MKRRKRSIMIVNVAGFGYSGGTAVALLLKEYGFDFKEGRETKELDFPMGIFALESLLFDTPSWAQDTIAIDYFIKMAQNTLYFDSVVSNLEFDENYYNIMMQYYDDFIAAICNLENRNIRYSSYSSIYSNAINRCDVKMLKSLGFHTGKSVKRRIWNHILREAVRREKRRCTETGYYYVKVSREEYIQEAARLIQKIINVKFGEKNVVAQNMIVPGHTNRQDYLKESHIKSIIVYRDPRDQYIKLKMANKVKNVESFISFYRRNMDNYKKNTDLTLIIRLEDLIFHSQKTERIITDFLQIKREEKREVHYFVPEESARMTRDFMKEKYQTEDFQKDIEKIEKELREYLYDFGK